MAFGRKPETNKNPSPRFPIQASNQQARPQAQSSNTLAVRPTPIPAQSHDGGSHAYTAPPATTYLSSSGWGQSTQVPTKVQETWPDKTVQGPTLCDLIASRFDEVLTSIDGETFNGDERELGAQINYIFTIRSG